MTLHLANQCTRNQDPLSELVKVDPKSLGVKLYQHDINAKLNRSSNVDLSTPKTSA